MKKVIKYLILIVLIAILMLLFFIIKNNKANKNISSHSEFRDYNQEYVEQKKKYECNEFDIINITTDELVQIYFNDYKNKVYENIENAYKLLDEEYKNKRFGNLDTFKNYINNNLELLNATRISSYNKKDYGSYTQYICIDNYGNYYIFNETAVMEFTLMLDTYTIDLPQFTEKYTSGTEQQKVALNIDKFIQAINMSDYKYAYNCLADSFKNNYFKTQAEFEEYAKGNFYEKSIVTYNAFDIQGDVYTFSVTLTNQQTNEKMNKTFIMQLGEGTEFKLSFDR